MMTRHTEGQKFMNVHFLYWKLIPSNSMLPILESVSIYFLILVSNVEQKKTTGLIFFIVRFTASYRSAIITGVDFHGMQTAFN